MSQVPPGFPPSPPVSLPTPGKPSNNLVWAILSTLLCCLPFGIVSIVYASRVDGLWMQGLHAEAADASRKAMTWAWVGAAAGIVFGIAYAAFMFLVLAAQAQG